MKKLSLGFISFLQALGIVIYCGLVGAFMLNAGRWFGPMPTTFLGPTLLLTLFVVSAVICALIFGYYPFILFWEQKDTKKALKLVTYTTGWLFFFLIAILFVVTSLK